MMSLTETIQPEFKTEPMPKYDSVLTADHQHIPDQMPALEYVETEEKTPNSRNTCRRNAWGNMSYADLITKAILSSPDQRLTLAQVYDWMVQNIPYFKDKGDTSSSTGWKNSIRHNLSLHNRFVRVQGENGSKNSFWTVDFDAKQTIRTPSRRRDETRGAPSAKRRGRHKRRAVGADGSPQQGQSSPCGSADSGVALDSPRSVALDDRLLSQPSSTQLSGQALPMMTMYTTPGQLPPPFTFYAMPFMPASEQPNEKLQRLQYLNSSFTIQAPDKADHASSTNGALPSISQLAPMTIPFSPQLLEQSTAAPVVVTNNQNYTINGNASFQSKLQVTTQQPITQLETAQRQQFSGSFSQLLDDPSLVVDLENPQQQQAVSSRLDFHAL